MTNLVLGFVANSLSVATFLVATLASARRAPGVVAGVLACLAIISGLVLLRWRRGKPGRALAITAVLLLGGGFFAVGGIVGRESVSTVQILSLDDAVARRPCHSQSWHDDPAHLGRDIYDRGILCPVLGPELDASLDFNVPAGQRRLSAVVGIDDRSSNTTAKVEFSVVAQDGRILGEKTLVYGESYTFDISLDHYQRFAIRVKLVDFRVSPTKAQSFSACLADLRLDRT